MVEWRLRQLEMLKLEPTRRWPNGSETVIHGDDRRCVALTLRTHPGPAVAVVAIGPFEEVVTHLFRWPQPCVELARAFPPVVVKFRGQRHVFVGENGPSFIGSAKAGPDALLLLGFEGTNVVVYLGDGARFRRCVSMPYDEIPQCIDLDELTEQKKGGRKTAKPRAERPPGWSLPRRLNSTVPSSLTTRRTT